MQEVENIKKRKWNKSLRWYLLVSALFFLSHVQAQLTVDNVQSFPAPKAALMHFNTSFDLDSESIQTNFKSLPPAEALQHTAAPAVYSYHHLGIMCKLDVQLEKSMKLPVKFRLGTQEYVDRLEGKY